VKVLFKREKKKKRRGGKVHTVRGKGNMQKKFFLCGKTYVQKEWEAGTSGEKQGGKATETSLKRILGQDRPLVEGKISGKKKTGKIKNGQGGKEEGRGPRLFQKGNPKKHSTPNWEKGTC